MGAVELGRELARLRRARGWSQAELASHLARVSGCQTITRHEVSRYERGQRSPKWWLPWFASVLQVPVEELQRLRAGDAAVVLPDGVVDRTVGAVERREFLGLSAAVLAGPMFGRLEVEEILAHLREQWHILVRTDNLLGPRHALEGVRAQLSVLVDVMKATRGTIRRDAVTLGAQFAESAAWLHEDFDDLAQARYWTRQAMEWAYEADDAAMMAWTAYRRSQQAAGELDAPASVALAQAARRDEHRLRGPMRAATRVQEAYGHAMQRSGGLALDLLDEAHRWAVADTTGDARGGHGSFCTVGYIETYRAACLRVLGSPAKAIGGYERALPQIPAVYRRDRAAALVGKAAAHLDAGELDAAATTAIQALPVAHGAGSQRTVSKISMIADRLAPHAAIAEVADLRAALSAGR